ncbi:MAG: hypothetical protein QUU85_06680, partial [Candidatus Eisenbacteria bacterium]|nr:hypothetical protein [Candidatus Eisenbacteria bacterium]
TEAIRPFVRMARSYVQSLREHIAKEDDCLADVLRTGLSREDRAQLAAQLDERERQEFGEDVFERFSAVVEDLERRCERARPA